MNKKERPAFLRNFRLKLSALAIAVIMWLLVTNLSNPVTYRPITNVPVRLTRTELITDSGQVYKVLNGTDTIPVVTVAAPRSISDAISRDNIIATADMTNLREDGTVPITISSNIYGSQIESMEGSIETVRLSIENRRTAAFMVQVSAGGTPAEGFVAGDVTAEQNQLRVSGPESVVSSIRSASAYVDVSGASTSITTYADIHLFDEDGEEVSTDGLSMNISAVKVTAAILSTKTVPFSFRIAGTPAVGYMYNGIVTAQPAQVTVAGRASVLAALDTYEIPSDELDISGLTRPLERTIDVTQYLPDNVRIADGGFDGWIDVVVGVEPRVAATIEIPADMIELTDVPDGYSARIEEDVDGLVSVRLTGLSREIEALSPEDISPQADVGEAAQGAAAAADGTILEVPLTVTLPGYVVMDPAVTVSVRLTPQE